MRPTGNKTRAIFKMNSTIIVLGLVSLFTDLSSNMIVPVLPLFLTNVLHVQVAAVGIIEGIAESTASILKIFSGWLSDKFGHRKTLMVAGYGLSNLIKPFFALSTTWGQTLTIRFVDRIGKGVRAAPRDAVLADSASKAERGKAFGFRRSMDTLGAALGPLAAFYILAVFPGNYRAVFWLSAIPGLIAVVLLVVCLKDPRRSTTAVEREQPSPAAERKQLPQIGFKNMNRRFVLFTLVSTLFAVANFSDAFLILRAQDVGMAVAMIPIAYLVFNLVTSIFSMPVGMLSDRIGRRPVLVAGYLIFAVIYAGFGFVQSVGWMWLLFVVYGLYYAATDGIQKAYITDLVPEGQRGAAMGTFNALTGLAALPASVIAGVVWQTFGAAAAFGVSGALAVLSAVLLIVLRV